MGVFVTCDHHVIVTLLPRLLWDWISIQIPTEKLVAIPTE